MLEPRKHVAVCKPREETFTDNHHDQALILDSGLSVWAPKKEIQWLVGLQTE